MLTSELILGIVLANSGEIEGKTTIQKLAYFSNLKIRVKDTPIFRPHFYGPYSAQVDFYLDELVALGFLSQSTRTTINERIIYDFRISSQGEEVITTASSRYAKDQKNIEEIVSTCKKVSGLNPMTLSYAAKVHYILNKINRPVAYSEVERQADKIGWKIDPEGVRSGAELLVALKLAKKSRT